MWKSAKSRAEQQFAAGQKKDQTLIKQKEKAQQEREERMTRLRNLRLAKEAADRKAAQQADSQEAVLEKTGAAPSATETSGVEDAAAEKGRPLRLPRVHPHQS
jgi:hypothetical protein